MDNISGVLCSKGLFACESRGPLKQEVSSEGKARFILRITLFLSFATFRFGW